MFKASFVEKRLHGTENKLLKVFYEDEKGQKQGCYIEFYPGTDNLLTIRRYVDNLQNGRSFVIDPDKEISSIIYYKDDFRHGPSKYFYKHVKPSEIHCYYQFDIMEGERIEV